MVDQLQIIGLKRINTESQKNQIKSIHGFTLVTQ